MSMPRLHFHSKLLLAFGAVLLPVLVLLARDFCRASEDPGDLLESQGMTAQAVAVQITESFESAIEFGRAVANDPLVQGMDSRQLDAHLQRLASATPSMTPSASTTPRASTGAGASRRAGRASAPHQRSAVLPEGDGHGAPVISEVIELRRPKRTAILVSVPIPGPRPARGRRQRRHADRPAGAALPGRPAQSGQEIFLVDPTGRLPSTPGTRT